MKNNKACFISFSFDHRDVLDIAAHYSLLRWPGRSGGDLQVMLANTSYLHSFCHDVTKSDHHKSDQSGSKISVSRSLDSACPLGTCNLHPPSQGVMTSHPLTWQMRSSTPWLEEPSCPHCTAVQVGYPVSGCQTVQGTGCWNSIRRCTDHEDKVVSNISKKNFQFLPLYMLMYSHKYLFIYLLVSL